jgi:hypothetical protein
VLTAVCASAPWLPVLWRRSEGGRWLAPLRTARGPVPRAEPPVDCLPSESGLPLCIATPAGPRCWLAGSCLLLSTATLLSSTESFFCFLLRHNVQQAHATTAITAAPAIIPARIVVSMAIGWSLFNDTSILPGRCLLTRQRTTCDEKSWLPAVAQIVVLKPAASMPGGCVHRVVMAEVMVM